MCVVPCAEMWLELMNLAGSSSANQEFAIRDVRDISVRW